MPNSQIEMVVMADDPGRWKVCGDFERPPDGRVDVYVVVRQGDVVARGHEVVSSRAWQFEVVPEGGELVAGSGQTAIASAVAIARQEDPSGLEAFTWAQRIPVLERRTDANPPVEFGAAVAADGQGTLAAGRSISSSLTVREPSGPEAGDGQLAWRHALEVH
ncbi:MAG TPA: hypothetical protein VHS79_00420 [Actinomycetes bacterium]|jgi:hypothetical protein|nr:hypothetical protein [Actinomycetes bacterium]